MRRVFLVLALLALAAPAAMAQSTPPAQQPVQAQIVIPPEDPDNFLVGWIGTHFSNGLSEAWDDYESKPKTMGFSYGFWARSWVSGEFDFGYSKDFFGDPDFLGGNNLMTLTGSVIVGPWIHITDNQIIRPYGVLGGGLARAKIEDFISFGKDTQNRGVIDYGGGIMVYLVRQFGLRGDVRIMRDVGSDPTDLEDGWGFTEVTYKRATIGVFLAF